MTLLGEFALAAAATVVVELIVAFALGYRDKRSVFAVIVINLITNPIANALVILNASHFVMDERLLALLIEIAVVLAEWGMLALILKKKRRDMLLLSLAMNAASYLFGFLLWAVVGLF